MVFLFLPSGGGKLKDQIMVQKTRIWSFKIRVGMDVSVSHNFPLFHHLMKTYRKQILIVPLVEQLVLILYIALYLVIRCDMQLLFCAATVRRSIDPAVPCALLLLRVGKLKLFILHPPTQARAWLQLPQAAALEEHHRCAAN